MKRSLTLQRWHAIAMLCLIVSFPVAVTAQFRGHVPVDHSAVGIVNTARKNTSEWNIEFGDRRIVVRGHPSDKIRARAAAFLQARLGGGLVAVSMLHPLADAPILRRVDYAWGAGVEHGKSDEARLARIFQARSGERLVLFGHIEAVPGEKPSADGRLAGRFVAQAADGAVSEISLARIQSLARRHDIEVIILGCESFRAGASAGPLRVLRGYELPAILTAMRGATTRGALFAAMATAEHPVIVAPGQLVAELLRGGATISRSDGVVPIAWLSNVPDTGSGLSWLDRIGLGALEPWLLPVALTIGLLELAVLVPLRRIVVLIHRRTRRFARARRWLQRLTFEGTWFEAVIMQLEEIYAFVLVLGVAGLIYLKVFEDRSINGFWHLVWPALLLFIAGVAAARSTAKPAA